MPQLLTQSLSLADFLALPETKPASEYINGTIVQKTMPQGQHSRLQQKLTTAINLITEDAHIALALPELRCNFGNRSIVPDIAVFTWDRVPTEGDGTIANQFNAHPDWTIEILSPDQSMTRVTRNILHCLDQGCQMGWIIDPQERAVVVYQRTSQGAQSRFFEDSTDRLPTPNFISDLSLTIEHLFNWLKLKNTPTNAS